MKRRASRKTIDRLVTGRLEGISGEVFADYSKQITELAGKKPGIYALYRKKTLYYVGLATNLKNRIKHHLHDRHAGKWDTFSLFLVRKDAHLKDLEAMTIRIARPKGNSIQGSKIPSLKPALKESIDARNRKKTESMLGLRDKPVRPRRRKPQRTSGKKGAAALAPYVSKKFAIRLEHKGKRYIANVRQDGTIRFSAKGAGGIALRAKKFTSPSFAASAVLGHPVNGWRCWRFRHKGDWVILDELRKAKR